MTDYLLPERASIPFTCPRCFCMVEHEFLGNHEDKCVAERGQRVAMRVGVVGRREGATVDVGLGPVEERLTLSSVRHLVPLGPDDGEGTVVVLQTFGMETVVLGRLSS